MIEMATEATAIKVPALTVRDLMKTLVRTNPNQLVYVDICEVCEARILSFTGPEIDCPSCQAKTTLRPLPFRSKKA